MLDGLGHDAFIGGDHQEGQVHPAGAGDHLLDELLVPGHVHHAQKYPIAQIELGETQLDADAPLPLFFQAIGIGAGQGGDQRCLAVVHVAGCAEDVVAFRHGVMGSCRPGWGRKGLPSYTMQFLAEPGKGRPGPRHGN